MEIVLTREGQKIVVSTDNQKPHEIMLNELQIGGIRDVLYGATFRADFSPKNLLCFSFSGMRFQETILGGVKR